VSADELRLIDAYSAFVAGRQTASFCGWRGLASDDVVSGRSVAQILALLRADVARLASDLSESSPRPCSSTWLALADADLLRRSGDTATALTQIRAERERCEVAGDRHGAALCWLAEGDARACVMESPAILGLCLDSG